MSTSQNNPTPHSNQNTITDSTYSTALSHRIQVMRDLFRGRTDAFGLCVEGNSFVAKNPIKDLDYKKHIAGEKNHRIGILLLVDGGVHWAVIDIDREDREAVEKICFHLRENRIFPHIERSKSKGYHIWIFFDGLIGANVIRGILKKVISDAGFKDQFEVFPKQDGGTFGNYVFLPEHGESVRNERTVFLDSDFTTIPDQWEYLESPSLTKIENMQELYRSIGEEPKARETPSSGSMFNVAKYLREREVQFSTKQDSNKTLYLLPQCFWADQHTTADGHGDSAIIQDMMGLITYHCFHAHCVDRTWSDVRNHLDHEQKDAVIEEEIIPDVQKKSITNDLRIWFENCEGSFSLSQIYADLCATTKQDRNLIQQDLGRLLKKGQAERLKKQGEYRKINSHIEKILMPSIKPVPLDVVFPCNIEKYLKVYKGNIIVIGGTPNSGKTAYVINVAKLNMNDFKINYISSEMRGEEIYERLEGFQDNCIQEMFLKIDWIPCTADFQDVINPGAINIVDYLEIPDGEFFKVQDQIRKIFDKLQDGIAIICIQKNKGAELPRGGTGSIEKARIALMMDNHLLTVVKGKLWKGGQVHHNLNRRFKLWAGVNFVWDDWEERPVLPI